MSFIASILPALIVLGILIIIHEFGHFLACRFTGVRVEKFSIGFGPEVLHWQGKETRYSLSLFPLGGFVKPAGESISEVESGTLKPGDYLAASLPARIFIVVAGVIMNYFLAFVLFAAIFMMGRPIPGTTIGEFMENYPAAQSQLEIGDRITVFNGTEVSNWKELTEAIDAAPAGTVQLEVERGERIENLSITPKVEEVKDIFGKEVVLKRLGIMPDPKASGFERYGVVKSFQMGWETTTYLTVMTHKAIFYMFMGKLSMKAMSGPIGIISMTGTAYKLGLPYLLQLTATLSVSLAVINLLPIPALDGGHLVFLLIEGIRRKRVSLNFQEKATQVGFFLLLTLMAVIIFNDLTKIEFFDKVKGFFVAS